MPENKKQQFEQRMADILNYGALNLAMSIGYKTGLFDAMAQMDRPAPAGAIAETAGLHPRYVAEWLGVMATGGIIEIHTMADSEEAYCLPPEHAAFLTRHSGDANLGVYTQEIPLLTRCALKTIEQNFYTGGGIPFSTYPEFQSFMAELSDAKHEKVLVGHFLPGVDNGRLVRQLEKGIRVCDMGCGQGIALQLMAKQFPESAFTGIDNHEAAIDTAQKTTARLGLDNLEFVLQDAAAIREIPAFENRFDYVTAFDSVHDQTRPLDALKSVFFMLSGNGAFSMVDIDAQSRISQNKTHPMGPFLYTVSLMHCMPVGLSDGGTGLGMMWGRDRAVALLKSAGFKNISVCEMQHDPFNVHYFCRKQAAPL